MCLWTFIFALKYTIVLLTNVVSYLLNPQHMTKWLSNMNVFVNIHICTKLHYCVVDRCGFWWIAYLHHLPNIRKGAILGSSIHALCKMKLCVKACGVVVRWVTSFFFVFFLVPRGGHIGELCRWWPKKTRHTTQPLNVIVAIILVGIHKMPCLAKFRLS